MPGSSFSDDQLQVAIDALSTPERFRQAEQRVATMAPQLQKVLAVALADGGWFDDAHTQELAKIAALEDGDERLTAFRTLLADEAHLGMMVGVAVGWELARELEFRPAENG